MEYFAITLNINIGQVIKFSIYGYKIFGISQQLNQDYVFKYDSKEFETD